MRTHAAFRLTAVAATLALALSPSAVLASGFQLVEQNGSGLGNAFSGQAAGVKDASAIYFNPAALTGIEGGNLVLSIEPIIPSYEFNDGGSTAPSLPPLPGVPPLGIPLGGTGGNAGGVTPVPNGYFSYQVADNWWLGLGVNIPFGLTTEWESDWMGRFHGIKSSIHAINVNPTVAVKLGALSLGAGRQLAAVRRRAHPEHRLRRRVVRRGVRGGRRRCGRGHPGASSAAPAGLSTEGLTSLDGDIHRLGMECRCPARDRRGWQAGGELPIEDRAHARGDHHLRRRADLRRAGSHRAHRRRSQRGLRRAVQSPRT